MRLHLIILALAGLLFAALTSGAQAELKGVRLTKDQVLSACGKNYSESNGLGGCTIPCYGGQTCDFSCGGDVCSGRASKAMVAGRSVGHVERAYLLALNQAVILCGKGAGITMGGPFGCTIPCDPVYICQIFCGGRSYCAVSMQYVRGKPEPDLNAGSMSSGGGGKSGGSGGITP